MDFMINNMPPSQVGGHHQKTAWYCWGGMVAAVWVFTLFFLVYDIWESRSGSPDYVIKIDEDWQKFTDVEICPPSLQGKKITGTFSTPILEDLGTWATYHIHGDLEEVVRTTKLNEYGCQEIPTSLLKPDFPKQSNDMDWQNDLLVSVGFRVDDVGQVNDLERKVKNKQVRFELFSKDYYGKEDPTQSWETFWDRVPAQVMHPTEKNVSVMQQEFSVSKVTRDFYPHWWDFLEVFPRQYDEMKVMDSKKPSENEQPTQVFLDAANITDAWWGSKQRLLYLQLRISVLYPQVTHFNKVSLWKKLYDRVSAAGGIAYFITPIFTFFFVLKHEPNKHRVWRFAHEDDLTDMEPLHDVADSDSGE